VIINVHHPKTAVLTPTQEAEIRMITVGSQPRQIVLETLWVARGDKKRAGGVAQASYRPRVQNPVLKKNLILYINNFIKCKFYTCIKINIPLPYNNVMCSETNFCLLKKIKDS
jgi:hypothetical protein